MASKMACYGLSQTQIADVLERDIRTVEEWLQATPKKVNNFICFYVSL